MSRFLKSEMKPAAAAAMRRKDVKSSWCQTVDGDDYYLHQARSLTARLSSERRSSFTQLLSFWLEGNK